jgi:hypothetical protein
MGRRTRHEGVPQVVFALGVGFDIIPFEVGAAAAADRVSHVSWPVRAHACRLPSLRTLCRRSMRYDVVVIERWREGGWLSKAKRRSRKVGLGRGSAR